MTDVRTDPNYRKALLLKTIETYKLSKMIMELLRQIVGTISVIMKETILTIHCEPTLIVEKLRFSKTLDCLRSLNYGPKECTLSFLCLTSLFLLKIFTLCKIMTHSANIFCVQIKLFNTLQICNE